MNDLEPESYQRPYRPLHAYKEGSSKAICLYMPRTPKLTPSSTQQSSGSIPLRQFARLSRPGKQRLSHGFFSPWSNVINSCPTRGKGQMKTNRLLDIGGLYSLEVVLIRCYPYVTKEFLFRLYVGNVVYNRCCVHQYIYTKVVRGQSTSSKLS